MKTLLSTATKTPISLINSDYFNNSLDLMKYGTVGDIIQFVNKGLFYITLTVKNANNVILLLFDDLTITQINIKEGVNYIYNEIKSNSSGFILISNDINVSVISTVNIDKINLIIYPPNPVNIWIIGDVNTDIVNGSCTLNTNKGRAISIVGEELFNEKDYLIELGVEASAIVLNNIPTGVYQFDIKRGIYDKNNNDSLYVYNGRNLSKIADTNDEIKTIEIEVVYEFIYLIAVDLNKTSGATEFMINNVKRLRDLPYFPPKKIPLIPNEFLGAVKSSKTQILISTGIGSRSINTIISKLNLEDKPIEVDKNGEFIALNNLTESTFTEGSYGLWNLPNGEYKINWEFKTSELSPGNADSIYFYDGLQLILNRSVQRYRIKDNETNVEIRGGKLAIIVLDEGTKTGTTEIKITKIEQINESLPDDEILKTDPVNQVINFNLGGDKTSIRYCFEIMNEITELVVECSANLIMEIADANNQVIADVEYEPTLIANLTYGKYYLSFFTESSMDEPYTCNLIFINP